MSKDDIINYVMNTPGNSNRAVLSSMLDQISGSGGGGLTLYGPYMATVHKATSVNANNTSTIALSDLYNGSMQLVDASQMTQDTKFFFIGFSCSNKNLSVLGASIPNELGGPYPTISCANNTESSISVNIGDIFVALYCSIELPLAESEG